MSRIKKLGILEKEKGFSPEEATVGFEMQPDEGAKLTYTIMDIPEIKKTIQYAGLGWQNDMPFEVVFPPTKTPIVQALMLGEVCHLIGIPPEKIGLQINFGGLTQEKNVKLLQRVMLAEGRLISDSKISVQGDRWDMGSDQKGEINMREPSSGTLKITPDDPKYPEFKSVGEFRASINAKSFFSLYRGLLVAHNLASAAKAIEREEKGQKLSEKERERADLFFKIKSEFNRFCEKKGIPPIDADWDKKDWQRYGLLIENKYAVQYFQRFMNRQAVQSNQS